MAFRKREIASIILVSISLTLIVLSASTLFPWAKFGRTREIGPVEYTLTASCDPIGFEYHLKTKPSGGGGLIGGGLGGNVDVDPGRKTYTEAGGQFLDNIGLIYDSYRDKEFVYELKMQDPPVTSGIPWDPQRDPSAYLNVTLHSDRIPFWWTSGENGMEVTIVFAKCDLYPMLDPAEDPDFSITVDSIEVVGWTKTDENGNFVGDEIILFSSEKGRTLRGLNDSVTIAFGSKYPGGADVLGIKARIGAHLTDFWGRPEKQTLSGSSGYINIYPVRTATLVEGAGIPLSIVPIVISVISGAVALVLLTRRSPAHRVLILLSSLAGIGASTWFFLGMNAAVDLLGHRLAGAEDGLSFGPGILICLAGGLLLLVVWIANIVLDLIIERRSEGSDPKFKVVG